jgi:hypothetical protein
MPEKSQKKHLKAKESVNSFKELLGRQSVHAASSDRFLNRELQWPGGRNRTTQRETVRGNMRETVWYIYLRNWSSW